MLTGDMLRRSAARFPDKQAIIYRGPDQRSSISYARLDALSNRLANALLGLGLGKGAKVSMLSRNLPEYGAVFFGVARTGYVLNNVSILYAPDELAWTLNKSDTEVLIFDAALAEKVAAVRASCPQIRRYVVIGQTDLIDATPFEQFIEGSSSQEPDVQLGERDPFCMTYTGGTTGRPKGVLVDHRARDVTAHTVMVEESIVPRGCAEHHVSTGHIGGSQYGLRNALVCGRLSAGG
jgi:fatty-acyl-CoA synthase